MIKYKYIYLIFCFFIIMFNYSSYFSNEQIVIFRHFITENRQNIELITSRLMLAMGFKMHLCGVAYLREAICYCYQLPNEAKVSFSKSVYPHIAERHASTARNVDRDIRTAIKSCYESKRMLAFNEICGYEIISPQYPPTNNEFVMQLVMWIKTIEPEYIK